MVRCNNRYLYSNYIILPLVITIDFNKHTTVVHSINLNSWSKAALHIRWGLYLVLCTLRVVLIAHCVFISAFYREAVENAVNYNSQLFQNKALRLPYLDAQTGIAQTTSPLLRSRLERRRGLLQGQIFSYPLRRWRREPRPLPNIQPGVWYMLSCYFGGRYCILLLFVCVCLCVCVCVCGCALDVVPDLGQAAQVASSAAGGLIQTTEGKRSTRIATQTRNDGKYE